MNLKCSLIIGLLGAFLMFLGDMVLYYDKKDYKEGNTVNGIIAIMKTIKKERLYVGGILGPISAFLYCIGFYHIVLSCNEKTRVIGWILFLINSLGMFFGGAYHSHCAYLGLLSRHDNPSTFDEFLNYLKFQAKVLYPIMIVGSMGLAIVILFNLTLFPRWIALVTPVPLIALIPLVGKLPKGFHMIIRGGWTNLVYVIYYLVGLIVLFTR